jgi:hypothetical protein
MGKSDSEKSKGMDLAGTLTGVRPVIVELSTFMKSVRPLLSKNDADLESALKGVAAPGGGKGLKHILTFIDNKVSFITNKLGE